MAAYDHLVHIENHNELKLYQLIPDVVWVFDLDKHGWWWGNDSAVKFWGLNSLDELINKDLSDDTQGARDRTLQTFELAAQKGLTIDPWTTYPQGKPKTLYMRHRAVTLGPQKHRGIIAYINEEVNLGDSPENLLLVEAMRYTQVYVTSFTQQGLPIIENPAATEAYKYLYDEDLADDMPVFVARFADREAGKVCLARAIKEKGGRYDHLMKTNAGERHHTLDIRVTRHPLSGEYILLVTEYDVTPLKAALQEAEAAKERLRKLAHYDSLTGLASQHLFQEQVAFAMNAATRTNTKLAIMFVDLDGFKSVNDTWGHNAGDKVLCVIADRLKQCVRESDTVARIGGDEFVLMQTGISEFDDTTRVAEQIMQVLDQPIEISAGELAQVGASIGIAIYPDQGKDTQSLLKLADEKMYRVKKAGKANYCL